ncbi:MAG: dethiobiotin synthase [Brumimicrobium sp.]|nr:dethiobiotin synthase [Brumimicrobium sp.]
MKKGFSIVGIGTDVGKTVVSAIVSEALGALYFKPIQAGDLDNSDSMKVRRYCSDNVEVAKEIYRLKTPMAPHGAAEIDGVQLRLSEIVLPVSDKPLVLEGAGGLMVPLNEEYETLLDIYKRAHLPVILVSRHYLGSINHTLLTADRLKAEKLQIAGIVYVGDENKVTESIIERFTDLKTIARIPIVDEITPEFVKEQSGKFKGLVYEFN